MEKNKRGIPTRFLHNQSRQVGSAVYGFREESTIVSHVGKQNKATILISTMHDTASKVPETQRPEIIANYDANTSGVDCLDEKCAKSTSSRRTRRWPLVIFFFSYCGHFNCKFLYFAPMLQEKSGNS